MVGLGFRGEESQKPSIHESHVNSLQNRRPKSTSQKLGGLHGH